MLNNSKAWWTLVLIQCTFVSVVLGAYWGIKTNIVALRTEVRDVERRVSALERSSNAARSTLPSSNGSAQVAARNAGTVNNDPAPGQIINGDADNSRESPVCVNKMTHLVFSCDRASKCLGANNFDGAYFKGLRAKLALRDSDTMMICDEKSPETAPTAPAQ